MDKIGMLTVNRMSIRRLAVSGTVLDVEQQAAQGLAEHFHEIVVFSILASPPDPFDPMENAFHDLGNVRRAHCDRVGHDHLDDGCRLAALRLGRSGPGSIDTVGVTGDGAATVDYGDELASKMIRVAICCPRKQGSASHDHA